jgi:uncharacterized membrane protein (UPF0127 family)
LPRIAFARAALLLGFAALACREPAQQPPAAAKSAPASAAAGEVIFLSIGGETWTLELALDPATRQRGLSGRPGVPPRSGMLFAFPSARPLAMVMRDCPEPIDVAFLDTQGRVVAIHTMPPEPPRRPDEGVFAYEQRLPQYGSEVPAQFAIELAGGSFARQGISVGDSLRFDGPALARRAR